MAVVAVNKDGTEVIGLSLDRCKLDDLRGFKKCGHIEDSKTIADVWAEIYISEESDLVIYEDMSLKLPNGSIKKLIGRELTWDDEPVELK